MLSAEQPAAVPDAAVVLEAPQRAAEDPWVPQQVAGGSSTEQPAAETLAASALEAQQQVAGGCSAKQPATEPLATEALEAPQQVAGWCSAEQPEAEPLAQQAEGFRGISERPENAPADPAGE